MKLARMPDGSPEIFYTLQGEGRHTGRPSVFIRASLCNLSCRWCDTPYTWNWDDTDFEHDAGTKFNREEQILDLSTSEITDSVKEFPCTNYVFTGGEPLLQEKSWNDLMQALTETSEICHFEIETNGTLFPRDEFLSHIHQFTVSPKLANSGISQDRRYNPEALSKLADTGKADFKFVVGGNADFSEIRAVIEECHLPADRIFLMPKAVSVQELEYRQSFVAELAQSNGFHYSDRLHLRLYGAKRGT